ncbi:hypothetical protein HGA89_01295 [bacterium]|nr:hypothetical protein [bacterium]
MSHGTILTYRDRSCSEERIIRLIHVFHIVAVPILLAGVAGAADYWPLTPGASFTNQDPARQVEIISCGDVGWCTRSYSSADCSELVDWTGIVATDGATWGEVKALYAR